MKTTKKTIETFNLKVGITQRDIDEGDCALVASCMYQLGGERSLRDKEEKEASNEKKKYVPRDHKVRVDAGVMVATFDDARWAAVMPARAKRNLHQFDSEKGEKAKAKAIGKAFKSAVKPHEITFKFQKIRKIRKLGPRPPERLAQIRAARAVRKVKTGTADHQRYKRWNERIHGLGNVG